MTQPIALQLYTVRDQLARDLSLIHIYSSGSVGKRTSSPAT